MRANRCKEKWQRNEATFGAWLMIPSSVSAEAIAHAGYDYVCIDMQHGLIDFQVAITMLQAISLGGSTPFVRVPSNDFAAINRVLDAGAMGVIIPLVNSPSEAADAVSACRYYPEGSRSWGPSRATWYAGADYFEHANAEVACVPMIETAQAVERLDEILAVPGVDGAYVGPSDLSVTLGLPPRPDNGGAFEAARLRIAERCSAHNVTAGIHANASLARKHVAAGYRMITVHTDVSGLQQRAVDELAVARSE